MKTSYLSKFCLCRSNAVIVSCLSVQVTPGPARPRHGTGPGCREKIAEKNAVLSLISLSIIFMCLWLISRVLLKINFSKIKYFAIFFSGQGVSGASQAALGDSALVSNIYRNKELVTRARISGSGLIRIFWQARDYYCNSGVSASLMSMWCSLQCDYQSSDTKVALTLEPTPVPPPIPARSRPLSIIAQ